MSLASWWRSLWATPAPIDPASDTLGAATLPVPNAVVSPRESAENGGQPTISGRTDPERKSSLPHVAIPPRPLLFTSGLIRAGFPACKDPDAWANAFCAASARFPQFNRLGWACILAKAKTEAGGLTRWDENLYYTTVGQVTRMHGSRAGLHPETLLRNPKALGDQVYERWGGYAGRGLGVIQLTGIKNHEAFARDMGMTLDEARAYMLTIPGAALTAPWYLSHYGATAAANRGDMRAVLAVVAGKREDQMAGIWTSIHGDQQMADYTMFVGMLAG